MAEGGRIRAAERGQEIGRDVLEFVNPYPWMSSTEARVHLALEEAGVPFSWRWFDGESPTFNQLLVNQGFQPEFTLLEHKAVVMVQGGFWGFLPGVLDKVALAQVALEADGWRVCVLFGTDIDAGNAWPEMKKVIPELGTIKGPIRPNPYGNVDLMGRLTNREHGSRPANPQVERIRSRERSGRRTRRIRERSGDGGRARVGSALRSR